MPFIHSINAPVNTNFYSCIRSTYMKPPCSQDIFLNQLLFRLASVEWHVNICNCICKLFKRGVDKAQTSRATFIQSTWLDRWVGHALQFNKACILCCKSSTTVMSYFLFNDAYFLSFFMSFLSTTAFFLIGELTKRFSMQQTIKINIK